jgi:hypothetical protein
MHCTLGFRKTLSTPVAPSQHLLWSRFNASTVQRFNDLTLQRAAKLQCLDAAAIPKSGRPNILKINSHTDCARNVLPTTSTPKAAAAPIIGGHHDDDALDPGPAQTLQTFI